MISLVGMNVYRVLDCIINEYKANDAYSIYREIKTWDYII